MNSFRLFSDGRLFFHFFLVHILNNADKFSLILLWFFYVLLHESYPHHQVIYFVVLVGLSWWYFPLLWLRLAHFSLYYLAQLFYFVVDAHEKLTDRFYQRVEGCFHVLLELWDDCWCLVVVPEKRCFHDVVGNGDKFFVLSIQSLYLPQDILASISLNTFGTVGLMIDGDIGIVLHFIEYHYDCGGGS